MSRKPSIENLEDEIKVKNAIIKILEEERNSAQQEVESLQKDLHLSIQEFQKADEEKIKLLREKTVENIDLQKENEAFQRQISELQFNLDLLQNVKYDTNRMSNNGITKQDLDDINERITRFSQQIDAQSLASANSADANSVADQYQDCKRSLIQFIKDLCHKSDNLIDDQYEIDKECQDKNISELIKIMWRYLNPLLGKDKIEPMNNKDHASNVKKKMKDLIAKHSHNQLQLHDTDDTNEILDVYDKNQNNINDRIKDLIQKLSVKDDPYLSIINNIADTDTLIDLLQQQIEDKQSDDDIKTQIALIVGEMVNSIHHSVKFTKTSDVKREHETRNTIGSIMDSNKDDIVQSDIINDRIKDLIQKSSAEDDPYLNVINNIDDTNTLIDLLEQQINDDSHIFADDSKIKQRIKDTISRRSDHNDISELNDIDDTTQLLDVLEQVMDKTDVALIIGEMINSVEHLATTSETSKRHQVRDKIINIIRQNDDGPDGSYHEKDTIELLNMLEQQRVIDSENEKDIKKRIKTMINPTNEDDETNFNGIKNVHQLLDELQDKIENERDNVRKMKQQLRKSDEFIEELLTDNEDLTKRNTQLLQVEETSALMDQPPINIFPSNDAINEKYQKLSKQLEDASKQIDQVKEERDNLISEVDELKNDIRSYQQEIEQYADAIEKQDEILHDKIQQINRLILQNTSKAEAERDEIGKLNAHLKKVEDEHRESFENLEQRISGQIQVPHDVVKDHEIESLKHEIDSFKKRNESLEQLVIKLSGPQNSETDGNGMDIIKLSRQITSTHTITGDTSDEVPCGMEDDQVLNEDNTSDPIHIEIVEIKRDSVGFESEGQFALNSIQNDKRVDCISQKDTITDVPDTKQATLNGNDMSEPIHIEIVEIKPDPVGLATQNDAYWKELRDKHRNQLQQIQEQHSNQCKKYENQIKSLQSALDSIERTSKRFSLAMEKDKTRLEIVCDELQTDIDEKQSENKALLQRIENLQDQSSNQYEEYEDEIQKLQAKCERDLNEYQNKNKLLSQKIEESQDTIQDLERQLNNDNCDKCTEKERQMEHLKIEFDKYMTEITQKYNEAENEKANVEYEMKGRDEKIETLQQRLKTIENYCDQIAESIDEPLEEPQSNAINHDLKTVERVMEMCENEINTTRQENEMMKAQIKELEQQNDNLLKELQVINSNQRRQSAEIDDLMRQRLSSMQISKNMVNDLTEIKKKNESLQKDLESAIADQGLLSAANIELKHKLSLLNEENKSLEERERVSNLNQKYDAEQSELKKTIELLNQNLKSKQSENKLNEMKYNESQKENQKLNEKLISKQNEINALINDESKTKTEDTKLEIENKELKNKLEELTTNNARYHELEVNFKELRVNYRRLQQELMDATSPKSLNITENKELETKYARLQKEYSELQAQLEKDDEHIVPREQGSTESNYRQVASDLNDQIKQLNAEKIKSDDKIKELQEKLKWNKCREKSRAQSMEVLKLEADESRKYKQQLMEIKRYLQNVLIKNGTINDDELDEYSILGLLKRFKADPDTLKDYAKANHVYMRSNRKLRKELEESINKIKALKTANKDTEIAVAQLRKSLTLKDEEAESVRSSHQSEIQLLNEKIELFQNRMHENLDKIKRFSIKMNELRANKQQMQREIDDLQQQIQRLEEQKTFDNIKHSEILKTNDEQIEMLKQMISDMEKYKDEWQQEIKHKNIVIEKLKHDLNLMENDVSLSAEIAATNLDNFRRCSEAKIAEYKQSIKDYDSRLQERSNEYNSLETSYNDIRRQHTKLVAVLIDERNQVLKEIEKIKLHKYSKELAQRLRDHLCIVDKYVRNINHDGQTLYKIAKKINEEIKAGSNLTFEQRLDDLQKDTLINRLSATQSFSSNNSLF